MNESESPVVAGLGDSGGGQGRSHYSTLTDFKIGDVVPNWVGLPITIEAIADDHLIGAFGGQWVPQVDDGGNIVLHPCPDPVFAPPSANGDAAAAPSHDGDETAAPLYPRFNEGDRVYVVKEGKLQFLEPLTITGTITPFKGIWGYHVRLPDGSESAHPEIHLQPTAEQSANGDGQTAGGLPPSSTPRPMTELMAHRFRPQEFLVDGLFAKGHLIILGGRPKGGKSWLALQLAKSIDTGADFLGMETMKARVLYYPLEDGDRRIQARARAINWQPESAAVLFSIPNLDDGQGGYGPGVLEIGDYTADYDLIIVDTLITAMSGRTDERDNSAMGRLINDLAYIAHKTDTAILIIHHTGKANNPDDIFSTLRGASAIRGGYDVGLILERKPGEREAVLHVESRDLDIRDMTLRQAENGAGWEYVGDAYEIEKVRAGRKVLETLLDHDDGDGLTTEKIAEIRKVSKATVHKQLTRLEADGYVCRDVLSSTQMGKRPDVWRVVEGYR